MTTHWEPGDPCIYRVRGGWGGGEMVKLVATVVAVHSTKVTIKLRDQRTGKDDLMCVGLGSLRRIETCPTCKKSADVYKLARGVYMCAACGQTIRRIPSSK